MSISQFSLLSKLTKQSHGFTLIEVLVSSSIGIGLFVVILNLFEVQKKNTDLLEFKLFTNEVTHEIKQILSNEKSCISTFKNFDKKYDSRQQNLEVSLSNHDKFVNGLNVVNQRGALAQIRLSKSKVSKTIILKDVQGIFVKGDFLDLGDSFNINRGRIIKLKTIQNENPITSIIKYRSDNKPYIKRFNLKKKNTMTKNIQQYVLEFPESTDSSDHISLEKALFKIYFESKLPGLHSKDLVKIIPIYLTSDNDIIKRCSTKPFIVNKEDERFLFMLGHKEEHKRLRGLTGEQACAKYSKQCAWMEMCIGYSPYDFEKHTTCYGEKTKRGHFFLPCSERIKFSNLNPSTNKEKDNVCRDHVIAYCTN